MPIRDLHNNINIKPGMFPGTATTDNTAYVSQIVDTQNFESAEFVILTGSLADVDATFTTLVEDGNAANLSDAVAVPDENLLGTENLASFNFANDNSAFKIGYVGPKRFARVTVTPTNNTGAVNIAGAWILGHPALKPTANPPA